MFDMDEAIKECEEKKRDDEIICFAIGAGRVIPKNRKEKKEIAKAMKFIMSLDGFLGIYPHDMDSTAIIFDTLNNAKGAYNLMKAKEISLGNIVPIMVNKRYLEGYNG